MNKTTAMNRDEHLVNGKKPLKLPPRKPVWNVWQALLLILIVNLIELPLGWLATPKDLDTVGGLLHFLTVGFGEVVLYFVVIFAWFYIFHYPFKMLGFAPPRFVFLVVGTVIGIVLFFGVGLLGNLLVKILGTPAPQSFAVAVKGIDYGWQFVLLLILGGIVAPLKEEVLFRGLIYPPLRQAYGKGKGILLTGLFFAALHFDFVRFLPLLIGGIVLTWLYERSASVWPSILAHGTWNLLMALALWIQR